jgi:hypothetical protein
MTGTIPTAPSPSPPDCEPSVHDVYAWHAENGHAPEWNGAGGIDCGSCGEHYGPQPQPETEPEAG